jgi:hypothetical protein
MVICVLGAQSKKKHETVQLPTDTVKRHIQDLPAHTKKQLVPRLRFCFPFSSQPDDSADVPELLHCHLFLYLTCSENETQEDLLSECAALNFFPFPQLHCPKLDYQGMGNRIYTSTDRM